MTEYFILFLIFIICYLIGSIPFGLILTKLFDNNDLRNIGSGNIGATNVLRTGNKTLALLTLILDLSKSFIRQIILEAENKNTHLEHLEDNIFNKAISFSLNLSNNFLLKSESSSFFSLKNLFKEFTLAIAY